MPEDKANAWASIINIIPSGLSWMSNVIFDWWASLWRKSEDWPLDLGHQPRFNLLYQEGFQQVRLILWNQSPVYPAQNTRVTIESVERMDEGPTVQSGQYTNLALKMERGAQGMTLSPDTKTEVFLVEHYAGNDSFTFLGSEPGFERCSLGVGGYRITLSVSATAMKTVRKRYRLSGTVGGPLEFSAA